MENELLEKVSELRRKQGAVSLESFADLYLPKHMKVKRSKAHCDIYRELFAMIKDRGRRLVVAAPRKFGKSTTVVIVYVLYCICYEVEKFIVLLSNTSDDAARMLDNIKFELTENMNILRDFQKLNGPKPTPWTRNEIETPNHIRIVGYGSGQSMRGQRYEHYRPTLVIGDDLDRADQQLSYEGKLKLNSWYEQTVLELGSAETNYVLLGNIHSHQCLLADFANKELHPRWINKVYSAIVSWPTDTASWDIWSKIYNGKELFQNEKGPDAAEKYFKSNEMQMLEGSKVLWPEKWTFYQLREAYEENSAVFDAEYQNSPIDPAQCRFNAGESQFWDEEHKTVDRLLSVLGSDVSFIGGCDPAMGKSKDKGDYTAIVVLVRNNKDGRLYLLHCDVARIEPDEIIETILGYHRRYRFSRFAIETVGFQDYLAKQLEEKARLRHFHLPLIRLKNIQNKQSRIDTLQPLIKSGTLQLNRMSRLLMEQLRSYPKCRYDDALDALQMACSVSENRQATAEIIGGGNDDLREWMSNFRGRGLRW